MDHKDLVDYLCPEKYHDWNFRPSLKKSDGKCGISMSSWLFDIKPKLLLILSMDGIVVASPGFPVVNPIT
jgi:hypothetical protein